MEEKLAEYRRQRSTQYTKVKTAAQIAQRKEEFNLLDYVPFSSLVQKILNRVLSTPFAQRIAEKLRWLSKISYYEIRIFSCVCKEFKVFYMTCNMSHVSSLSKLFKREI